MVGCCVRGLFRGHALEFPRPVLGRVAPTRLPATEHGPESHSNNGRQPSRSQLKTDLESGIGFEPPAIDGRITGLVDQRTGLTLH
jgi:hypothetical protein